MRRVHSRRVTKNARPRDLHRLWRPFARDERGPHPHELDGVAFDAGAPAGRAGVRCVALRGLLGETQGKDDGGACAGDSEGRGAALRVIRCLAGLSSVSGGKGAPVRESRGPLSVEGPPGLMERRIALTSAMCWYPGRTRPHRRSSRVSRENDGRVSGARASVLVETSADGARRRPLPWRWATGRKRVSVAERQAVGGDEQIGLDRLRCANGRSCQTPATYEDLLAVPDGLIAELIHGVLVTQPRVTRAPPRA